MFCGVPMRLELAKMANRSSYGMPNFRCSTVARHWCCTPFLEADGCRALQPSRPSNAIPNGRGELDSVSHFFSVRTTSERGGHVQIASCPEPASLALPASGLIGMSLLTIVRDAYALRFRNANSGKDSDSLAVSNPSGRAAATNRSNSPLEGRGRRVLFSASPILKGKIILPVASFPWSG